VSFDIAILQINNSTFANASNGVAWGFADTTGLVGPVVLVAWTAIIIGIVSGLRSNEHFDNIVDALGWVATSLTYVLHGVAAVAMAAVVMAPAYLLATADPGTRSTAGKYLVGGIVLYALLAGIGYIAKHQIFEPIRENIADVLPEPKDDEDADVDTAEVSD